MTATLLRLALSGLRTRRLSAGLTLLLVTVGAATLTLALHLRGVADDPWEHTFRETNGAHVLAFGHDRSAGRLAELPGVAEAAGPVPNVITSFEHSGNRYGLNAVGIGEERPRVERPVVTEGRWLAGDREIVLERSLARALGLGLGEPLRVKTTNGFGEFKVVGIAVLASHEPYPESQPGIAFFSRGGLALIQPDESRWDWTEALRLKEPDQVAEFVRQASTLFPPDSVFFADWREQRADSNQRNRTTAIVLSTFSVVLLIAIGFVLVTVVGGRALARHREIGLLKSVGFTPAQVSLLFLLEQLALGLVGSVAGVLLGALLAPVLARRSAEVLGGVPVEVSPLRLVLTVLAIEALVALATLLPTLRVARLSVLDVLTAASGGQSYARPARSVRLAVPLSLSLGLKDALARPRRTTAAVLALALTVGSLVAGLAFEATVRHEDAVEASVQATRVLPSDPDGLAPTRSDPVTVGDMTREQLRPIVHGLNAVLVLVAIVNLLAMALLAVRERVRDLGVLKTVGVTPAQLRRSIFAAHGLLGVAAALLGIPLGLALFLGVYQIVNGSTELAALPAWWVLALVPAATALAVIAVSTVPARRAAHLRVVDALRYE